MALFDELLGQIPNIFLHPMLYIGIILLILLYRRQINLERKLFSSRLHFLSYEVITSLAIGIIGGIIASIILNGLGVVFHPEEMWFVWVVSIILIIFNIRFLCLSYPVGFIGIIAGLLQLLGTTSNNSFIEALIGIHIPSLIAIVAILHLIEAILIRLKTAEQATPIFIETKRGKLVGAFSLQSYWLVPLFLLVVAQDGTGAQITSTWWPLIGGGVSLTFLPVPVMIGYSDLTSVYTPREKSIKASNYLVIYSIILLVLAVLSEELIILQIVAAFFAGFAHEGIRIISKQKEKDLPAKYCHPDVGLKVLAVLPNSIAKEMDIEVGEVITKVNGLTVNDRYALYSALQQEGTFVKLEVINLDGEITLKQHAIYDGDHYQLGIILAPDDEADFYIDIKKVNIVQLIKQKLTKINIDM